MFELGNMSGVQYSLATLVPRGLYATQVRGLLGATRELMEALPDQEFDSANLDRSLRELAARNQVQSSELFRVLRVALAWPDARPDLFEVIQAIGREGVRARLGRALTRLTDEAR